MTEDLFSEQKADLPEEWHEAFDILVGRGCAPTSALATIEWVSTEKTLKDVTTEYGTSIRTVRRYADEVVEFGPLDERVLSGPGDYR